MSVINTLSGYLGQDFQQNLMWQILVEQEFGNRIINDLSAEYFDDPNYKRLIIILKEYYKEYNKVPNIQSKTIEIAINKYKKSSDIIEQESLFAIVERIKTINDKIITGLIPYNGDVIQNEAVTFIKQQEYRKLGEFIIDKTKTGEIKQKNMLGVLEEKFNKISNIGDDENFGVKIRDNILHALRKEYRETIRTGITVLDGVTGGGLGKGEVGIILTPSGVGKAQPLSSKILTPNGWVKMGEIKINDFVIGSDGKKQKVLGVYPQGKRPIYKINFNDGTETFCDKEHLWSVNSLNNRTANTTIKENGKIKLIKTPDLNYYPLTTDNILKDYIKPCGLNYRIPLVKSVVFNKKDLPINPYLLGVLIGDGCLTECVRFTSIDDGIINNVNSIVKNNYKDLSLNQVSKTITFSISGKSGHENELYSAIKSLNLNVVSCNKFLPEQYKFTSIEDRILLLQGLLDTDGYASKNGRIQFTSSSKQLAYDVRELVLSLGGFCKFTEKQPKYKYLGVNKECKLSHILTISFSNSEIKPFSLKRKQDRVIYREKYKYNKYISSIKYSHEEDAQCIYVENFDHLYVTDDYILTHNTTTLTKIANTAYNNGKKVLQIIFEDTEDQVSRKHFAIWSGIGLSEMDNRTEEVADKVYKKLKFLDTNGGDLVIKVFSQENTTIIDIRNWIIKYQKKNGYKFDIVVLDYLDCLEPNKKSVDRQESELSIIKSFLALAADYDIPCWSAIQSNRGGFNSEFLEVEQMGGNVKRIQKSHFFMSIAKPNEHRDSHLVNIKILKARFVKDGQTFANSILNNDTLEISLNDGAYDNKYEKKAYKQSAADVINKLTNTIEKANEIKETDINKVHVAISSVSDDQTTVADIAKVDDIMINKSDYSISDESEHITIEEKFSSEITPPSTKLILEIGDINAIEKMLIDPDELDDLDRRMLLNKGYN